MTWDPVIAARNLSVNTGSGIWKETRDKLEDLASGCFGREAAEIAQSALNEQEHYDNGDYDNDQD